MAYELGRESPIRCYSQRVTGPVLASWALAVAAFAGFGGLCVPQHDSYKATRSLQDSTTPCTQPAQLSCVERCDPRRGGGEGSARLVAVRADRGLSAPLSSLRVWLRNNAAICAKMRRRIGSLYRRLGTFGIAKAKGAKRRVCARARSAEKNARRTRVSR